jgi:hypothetical protein
MGVIPAVGTTARSVAKAGIYRKLSPKIFWIPAGVYPDGNRGGNDKVVQTI